MISIPLLGMILLSGRMFFRRHTSPHFRAGLWSLWVVNLISFFLVASMTGREFNQGTKIEKSLGVLPDVDTLRIGVGSNEYEDAIFAVGPLQVAQNKLISRDINLDIEQSDGEHIELLQRNVSRGKSLDEARRLAQEVNYTPEFGNGKLTIDPYFIIDKGEKWRGQHVNLVLRVPKGKSIHFNDYSGYYVEDMAIDRQKEHPWLGKDQTWKMEEGGLVCQAYRDKHNYGKELKFEDFHNIILEGKLDVLVEQGDAYELSLKGEEYYASKVEFAQMGKTLTISSDKNHNHGELRLHIKMPELKVLDAEYSGKFRLQGFRQENMEIKYRGRHEMKALVEIDTLSIKHYGRGRFSLRGQGNVLKAKLDKRASFDAEHFRVSQAEIIAKGNSRATLDVVDQLTQTVSQGSKVELDGEAVVVDVKSNKGKNN
ncbi:MAG: DUF2807 domain-containing protein [Bacteroidota bacterium]